jgi:hypothetical protein
VREHPDHTPDVIRQNAILSTLNCVAALVMLGGWFDMLLPEVPTQWLDYLGMARDDVSPRLSALLLGLLRALGGCLVAVSITAVLIINGPLKRGEQWASWALVILIGVAEGINASQMWRFGSPYYVPLAVVAATIAGVAALPRRERAR